MLTRNLDQARKAYQSKDIQSSKTAHQQSSNAPEHHFSEQGKYVKSVIYGGLDGIITTFAIVAGVAGAHLSTGVVLILGFANLIADGLSMAIGDYLSTRAEREYQQAERARETWEVDNYPQGEKLEMVEIFEEKGISNQDSHQIVNILSKYKKAWIDIMMAEELGIIEEEHSPWKNALATFCSFVLFGFVPLIVYILSRFIGFFRQQTFLSACILTGVTLFLLGALKIKITTRKWYRSGLEMLVLGGLAAGAAYLIGLGLSSLV